MLAALSGAALFCSSVRDRKPLKVVDYIVLFVVVVAITIIELAG